MLFDQHKKNGKSYIAAKEGEEEILSLEESRLKSSHDENPKKNADVQSMCRKKIPVVFTNVTNHNFWYCKK